MEDMMETINELVVDAEEDLVKFLNGNNSAGTRVRKSMQQLKKTAQDLRIAVQNKKNADN